MGYQAKCGKKYFTCQVCPHRADEGAFLNKTSFTRYEELVVKILKDDLYYATLYMDFNGNGLTESDELITENYASSYLTPSADNEIVFRVDFSEDPEKYENFSGQVIVSVQYDYDPNANHTKSSEHYREISID